MSWLKPSVYIIGLLIVLFGGALLLDLAAPMLGLQHWLPNRQHTQQQVERQYKEMWWALGQQPIVTPSTIYNSMRRERGT